MGEMVPEVVTGEEIRKKLVAERRVSRFVPSKHCRSKKQIHGLWVRS
jgi:hypothetical protein